MGVAYVVERDEEALLLVDARVVHDRDNLVAEGHGDVRRCAHRDREESRCGIVGFRRGHLNGERQEGG